MEGEEWYLEDLTWCLSGMDKVNGRRGSLVHIIISNNYLGHF